MKTLSIFIIACFLSLESLAQVSLKTEFIGNSAYMYSTDSETQQGQVGDREGSAVVNQASIGLPLHMWQKDTATRPMILGISLSGVYAKLYNHHFHEEMVSEIMDLQTGLFFIWPLNEKWSVMASGGAGVYAPFTTFSKIRSTHVLGSAGAVFIRHLTPTLDLGGGLALNNSFGYPLLFPALYFNWSYVVKVKAPVSLGNGLEASIAYAFNSYFCLSAAFDVNGQMAIVETDGKEQIFTHQYMVTGARATFRLGKTGLSIPITAGVSSFRPAYYSGRSLRSLFVFDNDYYFNVAPYASVGLTYGL